MGKKLFLRTDPQELDRYTKKNIPRRRQQTLEVIRGIDLLKRAMQALPPRELQMLFVTKVHGCEQDDVTHLFNVRQSNISYRLDRAETRIQLQVQLLSTCSETALRRALHRVGVSEPAVRAILGVVKTSSQSATAEALEITQGSVRSLYAAAIEKLKAYTGEFPEKTPSIRLLEIIEMNYNNLRSIRTQKRWDWKVGDTNYSGPKRKPDETATTEEQS
jgi:DNA-directed RNA polymerase specialized sigma24 family protein